jgi:hypothetical protein
MKVMLGGECSMNARDKICIENVNVNKFNGRDLIRYLGTEGK